MSRKMGFQRRRNAKGLLPSASHETVGIIYLPLATTTAPRHRSSNRSGGNTSPVEKEADQTNQPTNSPCCDRGSETEFGHNSNLIRALRRAKEERPWGASRPLHTTTTLHFVRCLSHLANERGSDPVAVVSSFVRWHFEFGRGHSPFLASVLVATFPRE